MADSERRRLGRDFNSLFEDNLVERDPSSTVMIRVSDIEPSRGQPRKKFDDASLAELAASISSLGLLQPIVVTENINYPGTYRILAGERRWRASRLAGLTEIPCIVFSGDDLTAARISLVENIQREDLSAVELAAALRDLMEKFGLTQDEVAEKTGKSRPAVANTLRLLDLPEAILELVDDGRLSAGHARALIPIKDRPELNELAQHIITDGMSVRQTEKAVHAILRPVKIRDEKPEGPLDAQTKHYLRELQSRAMELSGHRVQISDGGEGHRKLVIDYSATEDLEELLVRICGKEILSDN